MIGANQIKQFRLRKPAGVIAHGVDGVGNAAALDFLFIDFAPAFSGQRQAQQAQPFVCRGRFVARFERGLRRRNKEKASQRQFFIGGLGDQQVT